MANKKKRTKKKHQGMKKPSKRPEVLNKHEKDTALRNLADRFKRQPKQNLDHKVADDQHMRRGNR